MKGGERQDAVELDRLAAKQILESAIHRVGDCWVWAKGKTGGGYGVLAFGGRQWYAHRLSYLVFRGPLPRGKCVCHSCDNPSCFNPNHLFIGSHRDNLQDASAKARMARGDRHPKAKLTEHAVRQIRRRAYAKEPIADLAARFGVSVNTAVRAHQGKTWGWVKEEPAAGPGKPRGVRSGSDHPGSKLSLDDVRRIRRMRSSGERIADIARDLGVRYETVNDVYIGRTWKHVGEIP